MVDDLVKWRDPAALRHAAMLARLQGMYAKEHQLLQQAIEFNTPEQRDEAAHAQAAEDTRLMHVAFLNSRAGGGLGPSGGDGIGDGNGSMVTLEPGDPVEPRPVTTTDDFKAES